MQLARFGFSPLTVSDGNALGLAMLHSSWQEMVKHRLSGLVHSTNHRYASPMISSCLDMYQIWSVGGTISIIRCSQVKAQDPDHVPLDPAIIISYVCTLITTIYCTCKCSLPVHITSILSPYTDTSCIIFLAVICWHVSKNSRISASTEHANSLASRVIFAAIQSGALYTLGILAFLVTYLAHTLLQCVPLDSVTPLVVRSNSTLHPLPFGSSLRATSDCYDSHITALLPGIGLILSFCC